MWEVLCESLTAFGVFAAIGGIVLAVATVIWALINYGSHESGDF